MTTMLTRPTVDDATRREFIALLGTAGLLTACSSRQAETEQGGGWSFTDDRGVTVDLPSRPTRVAAYTAPGAALLSFGVRPVAIFGNPLDDPLLAGLDVSGIASAGPVYGEVDIEKLAALGVELVVTAFDPNQDGPVFGFNDGPAQGRVSQLAPIVAINGIRDPDEVIRGFGELAAALGADLQAPAVVASRQRYDAARARRCAQPLWRSPV